MKDKKICIIPARKGSKRIKNKNIKNFCGKPIILQLLKKIIKFEYFDEIFISTNCKKLPKLVKNLPVKIIKRSEELSNDYTDTKTVILDAINKIHNLKISFNKVFCIYPTSVFVMLREIKLAEKLLQKNVPFVFSAKEYEHPIQRSLSLLSNGKLKVNHKNLINKRTQSLKKNYHDAAQFYLGWEKSWKNKKIVFDKKSKFILLPKFYSVDIDELNDWRIAEQLWRFNKKNKTNKY